MPKQKLSLLSMNFALPRVMVCFWDERMEWINVVNNGRKIDSLKEDSMPKGKVHDIYLRAGIIS